MSRPARLVAVIVAFGMAVATHVPGVGATAAPRTTPAVLLQPATAVPGQTIKAKGRGFIPSSVVTVDLDSTVLGTVTSSQSGRWVLSVAVPSTTLPGPHTVTASDPAGVTASAALSVSTPWASFRFDPAGTGSNPFENVLSPDDVASVEQAGTLDFAGAPSDTPASAGGILYFGTDDGVLHAQALSGTPLWTHPTGGPIESSPALSPGLPSIGAVPGALPTVFVGSDDGSVYALDSASGDQRWAYPTGGPVRSSPVVVQLKERRALILVMFVGSDDGSLYSLDAGTGAVRWAIPLGGPITSSPAVQKGVIRTGSPEALTDEVVVGTEGGTFAALDAHTGAILWSADLGAPDHFSSPALTPAADPDPCRAFVGSMDGILHAFDCATGSPLWSVPTPGPIDSSPAVAPCDGCEQVVIGSEDGSLSAFDPAAGDLKWSTPVGGIIESSPTVAGSIIHIVDRPPDGTLAWTGLTVDGAVAASLPLPTAPGPFLDGVPIVVDGAIIPVPSALLHVRTDWPQSHLDPAHDGFQSYDYVLDQQTVGGLTQDWVDAFGAQLLGDAKEAGGQVFVSSQNGPVYALDAKTVGTKWQYAMAGEPVYAGGTVYVISVDGSTLQALDASTGSPKWYVPYSQFGQVAVGPVAVDGGSVYVSWIVTEPDGIEFDNTCGVDTWDAVTGLIQWTFTANNCLSTYGSTNGVTPAAAGGGLVFVGTVDLLNPRNLHVFALDPTNDGAQVWEYVRAEPDGSFCLPAAFTPTMAGNKVYVAWTPCVGATQVAAGELVAVDVSSGTEVWRDDITDLYTGPPAVAYARVYIGTSGLNDGNRLYVLGTFSGSTLWSYSAGNSVHAPAVANGVVYFGSDNGVAYALNAYIGGNPLWSVDLYSAVRDVSVANGRLFIPTQGGALYAYSI
jgi:outer membrane protein assembly factor BamB